MLITVLPDFVDFLKTNLRRQEEWSCYFELTSQQVIISNANLSWEYYIKVTHVILKIMNIKIFFTVAVSLKCESIRSQLNSLGKCMSVVWLLALLSSSRFCNRYIFENTVNFLDHPVKLDILAKFSLFMI
jgi:hypothetical protein